MFLQTNAEIAEELIRYVTFLLFFFERLSIFQRFWMTILLFICSSYPNWSQALQRRDLPLKITKRHRSHIWSVARSHRYKHRHTFNLLVIYHNIRHGVSKLILSICRCCKHDQCWMLTLKWGLNAYIANKMKICFADCGFNPKKYILVKFVFFLKRRDMSRFKLFS